MGNEQGQRNEQGLSRVPGGANARIMRSPVTLEDLTKDLLWPRLLKAGGLALSTSRLSLALMVVGCVFVLDGLSRWIGGAGAEPMATLVQRVWEGYRNVASAGRDQLGGSGLAEAVFGVMVKLPMEMMREYPVRTLIVVLPGVVILSVLGGAISRSAACEVSQNVRLTWVQSLGFALARWRSFAGAVLGPLVLIWGLGAVLWLGGWGFRVQGVDIITAVLFGLVLIASIGAAAAMVVYLLGQSMLIPAVACEGTDAFDGVQRAYAYTIARPGRLLLYTLISWGVGVVSVGVVSAVALLGVRFAAATMGLSIGEVSGTVGLVELNSEPAGTLGVAAVIIKFFVTLLLAGVMAYGVSYVFTAGTLLYLVMRQLVDGQDFHELWMPGLVDATLARADAPSPLKAHGIMGETPVRPTRDESSGT